MQPLVLHICVSHTFSLAVLGLRFGHSGCGWEGIGEEGEARAGDEEDAHQLLSTSIDTEETRKPQGVKVMGFISLSVSFFFASAPHFSLSSLSWGAN